MALIRPIDQISGKWKEVTPGRSNIYKKNVDSPLRNWEANTLAAKDRRDAGLQEAINDGRIDRGIAKAGQAKWQKQTSTLGPGRWSEGVRMGEAAYRAGFAPYRDVIDATELPAKYPKGDPRNWDRSKAIGIALHQKKVSG